MLITRELLLDFYIQQGLSSLTISKRVGCSTNKINYWLKKFSIEKRSISKAIYTLNNPSGDPFVFTPPVTAEEHTLYGLCIGLYWGEGSKRNKNSVRICNTDPDIILAFVKFLKRFYKINESKIRFGLQLFNDSNLKEATEFWTHYLGFSEDSFYKTIVSKVRGEGTYKNKSKYGVITLYYNNTKLQSLMLSSIEKMRKM